MEFLGIAAAGYMLYQYRAYKQLEQSPQGKVMEKQLDLSGLHAGALPFSSTSVVAKGNKLERYNDPTERFHYSKPVYNMGAQLNSQLQTTTKQMDWEQDLSSRLTTPELLYMFRNAGVFRAQPTLEDRHGGPGGAGISDSPAAKQIQRMGWDGQPYGPYFNRRHLQPIAPFQDPLLNNAFSNSGDKTREIINSRVTPFAN